MGSGKMNRRYCPQLTVCLQVHRHILPVRRFAAVR